jgi:hypothetical protein
MDQYKGAKVFAAFRVFNYSEPLQRWHGTVVRVHCSRGILRILLQWTRAKLPLKLGWVPRAVRLHGH